MAVLGILARVDTSCRQETADHLDNLDGVSTFSVDEIERIGILVEGESLQEVQATLSERVESAPGILGAWPVYTNLEE